MQVGFSPNGKFVYFSLNGENALGKVDFAARKFVAKVPVGRGPIQVFVTPDDKYVLVANTGTAGSPDDRVSIVSTSPFRLVANVKTAKGAHGVTIDHRGKLAYVTNTLDDSVSVIDIARRQVTANVKVGKGPNGITFLAAL